MPMIRPTNASDLQTLLSATLTPAVAGLVNGATTAQTQAAADATKATADKAAADAASQQAAAELATAQQEQADAAAKGAQATKVQGELNLVSQLLAFVPKLSNPADQQELFTICNNQTDGLVADLKMSYDPPPAAAASSAS